MSWRSSYNLISCFLFFYSSRSLLTKSKIVMGSRMFYMHLFFASFVKEVSLINSFHLCCILLFFYYGCHVFRYCPFPAISFPFLAGMLCLFNSFSFFVHFLLRHSPVVCLHLFLVDSFNSLYTVLFLLSISSLALKFDLSSISFFLVSLPLACRFFTLY